MFGLRKKSRNRYNPSPTYKQRVEQFYQWFAKRADDLDEGFNNGTVDSSELVAEMDPPLEALIGGLGWCFGPALDKAGHHLCLQASGNPHILQLTIIWSESCPDLARWEFHPAKPRSVELDGRSIQSGGFDFEFNTMQVALEPNDEREMPNIKIFHESFPEIDEDARLRMTFIMLDEALGELGTDAWLAAIEPSTEPLEHFVPMSELYERVCEFYELMEWKQPSERYEWTLLNFPEPDDVPLFPQSDSLTKVTRCMGLVREYFGSEGKFDDPLLKHGAAYVCLDVATDWFPDGDQANARGVVEEAIEKALEAENAGILIGGGMGLSRTYIDFLITDGSRSIELILEAARENDVPQDTVVRFLDQGMRDTVFKV
jgi:hypothetical protein